MKQTLESVPWLSRVQKAAVPAGQTRFVGEVAADPAFLPTLGSHTWTVCGGGRGTSCYLSEHSATRNSLLWEEWGLGG